MSATNEDSLKSKWAIAIVSIILTGIITYFVTLAVANNAPPTQVTGQLTVDLVVKEMKENPVFQEELLIEVGAVPKALEIPKPTTTPNVQNNINIFVDGNPVQQNQPAFISDGSIYINMYDIGRSLNKAVEWDGLSNSLYIGIRPGVEVYFDDVLEPYMVVGDNYRLASISNNYSISIAGNKYYHGVTNAHYDGLDSGYYNLNTQYS